MAEAATNGAGIAEKYNLLPKLMPNLDRRIFSKIQDPGVARSVLDASNHLSPCLRY